MCWVAALFALLISFRKRQKAELQILQLVVLISVLTDLINLIDIFYWKIYFIYPGLIYRGFELVLLMEFYRIIFERKHLNIGIRFAQILLFGFLILNLYFEIIPIRSIRILNSFIFTLFAVAYFVKITVELKIENITISPIFWVNSALLLYFSGSVFFALFFEPLGKVNVSAAVLSFMFHNVLELLKNILFAIAFWISYKYPHNGRNSLTAA